MQPIAATVIPEGHPTRRPSLVPRDGGVKVDAPSENSDSDVSLQVVIAIAMPSQHSSSSGRQRPVGNARDHQGAMHHHKSDRLDYALGTVSMRIAGRERPNVAVVI
jgi:hypothetical protein